MIIALLFDIQHSLILWTDTTRNDSGCALRFRLLSDRGDTVTWREISAPLTVVDCRCYVGDVILEELADNANVPRDRC